MVRVTPLAPLGHVVVALLCLAAATAHAARLQRTSLRVLAIGDSITEGSVPSKNTNHPYTDEMAVQLRRKMPGVRVTVDNKGAHLPAQPGAPMAAATATIQQPWCSGLLLAAAGACQQGAGSSHGSAARNVAMCAGVGGGGIFAVGIHNPTTIPPVAERAIADARASGSPYDYVVVMLGINDLLRMGRSAEDVRGGLARIYATALNAGARVVAVPPFAAPGFVSRWVLHWALCSTVRCHASPATNRVPRHGTSCNVPAARAIMETNCRGDYKETERRKLAELIKATVDAENAKRGGTPRITVLNLQVCSAHTAPLFPGCVRRLASCICLGWQHQLGSSLCHRHYHCHCSGARDGLLRNERR
jgi:hypothetical protein